jgi:renalase
VSIPRTAKASDATMTDVVVVGAGIAGIACARTLTDLGARVCIAEKSGGVGGRIATRALVGVPFDYGAPILEASRSPFRSVLESLADAGALSLEREHGSRGAFASSQGLRTAIRRYAEGLRIDLDTRVLAIERISTGARVRLADGQSMDARHVVTTAPFPQSLALFGMDELSASTRGIAFSRGLVVALVAHGDSALRDGLHEVAVSGISRARVRRVEGRLLLVAFGTCALAERMLERDDPFIVKSVLESLRVAEVARLDRVDSTHVKRWTYATTTGSSAARAWFEPDADASGKVGPRIVAGDAFGGGTVEGAWESGVAVARALANQLGNSRLRRHSTLPGPWARRRS